MMYSQFFLPLQELYDTWIQECTTVADLYSIMLNSNDAENTAVADNIKKQSGIVDENLTNFE